MSAEAIKSRTRARWVSSLRSTSRLCLPRFTASKAPWPRCRALSPCGGRSIFMMRAPRSARVCRWATGCAFEQGKTPHLTDHGGSLAGAKRQHAPGDVAQNLHVDAAQTEGHHMAEHGVSRDADHQLQATARRHLLDQQTVGVCVGPVVLRSRHDVLPGLTQFVGVFQPYYYAADVGLMDDLLARDLCHHGVAHGIGS